MVFAFQLTRIALAHHTHRVVFHRHVVRRQVIERRAARRGTIVQLETRMVPRTANRLPNEHSEMERTTIVGALSADGEPVRLSVRQQHRFTEGVPSNELTWAETAGLDSLGQ